MNRNIWKTINHARDNIIRPRYDINSTEIVEIYKGSNTYFEMISNAFTFGYAQGIKGAKTKK